MAKDSMALASLPFGNDQPEHRVDENAGECGGNDRHDHEDDASERRIERPEFGQAADNPCDHSIRARTAQLLPRRHHRVPPKESASTSTDIEGMSRDDASLPRRRRLRHGSPHRATPERMRHHPSLATALFAGLAAPPPFARTASSLPR